MATLIRPTAYAGVRSAAQRLGWPGQLRGRSAWASRAATTPVHRPVEPAEAPAGPDRVQLQGWLLQVRVALAIPVTASRGVAADISDRDRAFPPSLQDADAFSDLAYCLSFAGDAGDFDQNFARLMDDRMRRQLEYSAHPFRGRPDGSVTTPAATAVRRIDTQPLPRSLADALRPTRRAVVITEAAAPFRVCDVNRAWEDLCGYSFRESKDRTLGSLLRGRDTDQLAATALVARLLAGEEEAGATLTNYTKAGRRFRNRLRAGPLRDERRRVTHFVGVLQEIDDGL